ncbi:MAG: hypothetical protein ABR544_03610 [Gammaproteobacteria bacterium]
MQPDEDRKRRDFILGNLILGLAALILLFMGPLWEHLGVWALILWMALAAVGVYLITKDKDQHPGPPL